MSDVMFYGILRMPYEMAMNDEMSRFQFYRTVQQAVDRVEALEKELKRTKFAWNMAENEIESLKQRCFEMQNAAIDLAKKNAFLEDWKKTWAPYIKEVHGINTTILRKAQEK